MIIKMSKPIISEVNVRFAARRACELLGKNPDAPTAERAYLGGFLKEYELLIPKVREQYAINSALMESGAALAKINVNL